MGFIFRKKVDVIANPDTYTSPDFGPKDEVKTTQPKVTQIKESAPVKDESLTAGLTVIKS